MLGGISASRYDPAFLPWPIVVMRGTAASEFDKRGRLHRRPVASLRFPQRLRVGKIEARQVCIPCQDAPRDDGYCWICLANPHIPKDPAPRDIGSVEIKWTAGATLNRPSKNPARLPAPAPEASPSRRTTLPVLTTFSKGWPACCWRLPRALVEGHRPFPYPTLLIFSVVRKPRLRTGSVF